MSVWDFAIDCTHLCPSPPPFSPPHSPSKTSSGAYALHPATREPLPIWTAEYVLGAYGTGAIMAVPAHDERDAAFAAQYRLPSRAVVRDGEAGGMVACASAAPGLTLDGLGRAEASRAVIDWLEARGAGRGRTQYKLRDWLFARQRYWGEPFPVVFPLGPDGSPDQVGRDAGSWGEWEAC